VETRSGNPLTSLGTATSISDFGVPLQGLQITGVWPGAGPTGSFVFVFGNGFEKQGTQVSLNGQPVFLVEVVDANLLIFKVPQNATSGTIKITTSTGTVTSSTAFNVIK
jgi:hypothetical protein